MSEQRADCDCRFVNATAIMCADHYAMLDEELAQEPRFVPALLRLVERVRDEATR